MTEHPKTAWVVALTGVGSLMGALDTVVVSNALTTIRVHLHASVSALEWTVNAYSLSLAVLLITGAVLGDRLGRRKMYATGLTLFSVASAACALAPNVGTLVAARAFQGAGAALLLPLSLTLLSSAFPPEKRGAAIGIFSAITGISVALGPTVGGAVVQGLSWQWIFWLNVPIGLAAARLAMTKLAESHGPDTSMDTTGLALISAGAFGLVWGLVRGNSAGWSSAEVVTSLAAGAVLVLAFVRVEQRTAHPMIPLDMFRSRAFTASNVGMFCTFASLFSAVFFFAQLLQSGLGYDPLGAGLRLLPWTATFITVAPVAGVLADRIGERPLMTTGLLLQATGMFWLASIVKAGMHYPSLLGPFIVAGVGVSLAIPSAQNSAMGSAGEDALGKASGVNAMMRELGGVFGIAVAVAVFAGHGGYGSAHSFVDGFSPAIVASGAFSLIGAAVASAIPSRRTDVTIPADMMVEEGALQ